MVKLKKNGLAGSDKVDTMNLLDSSDSDVEWLNLPPIKGKKPKRRKPSKQKQPGCSFWSILKPVLLLAVLGAVVLLTITTVWLTTQVSDLQSRLQRIEGKSVVSIEDIQKLYSQMSALNKSQELESKRLARFQTNISNINVTIFKLSEDVAKLGEGLKAAPELKQLPEKVQTVSKSLASLGSDVTGMKDTISSIQDSLKEKAAKLQDINSQIETLKQDADTDESSDKIPPELTNMIQTFSQKLEDINGTTSAQLSVLMKSLSQHEERFIALENVTDSLKKNLSTLATDHSTISSEHSAMSEVLHSEQFKMSVTDIVHDMLSQNSSSESGIENHPVELSATSLLTSVKDSLDRIQAKYNALNSTVQKNAAAIQDMKESFVPIVRFKQLGEGFQTYMQTLNATITELTAKVEGKTVPHQPSTKAPATESLTNKGTHTPKVLPTSTMNATASSSSKAPTNSSTKTQATGDNTVTQHPGAETTKVTQATTPAVAIQGIKTAHDLDIAFSRWDRTSPGQVRYEILQDYLPSKEIPKESELKAFDEDKNGLYSKQEFAKALGIVLNEEDDLSTEKAGGREP